MQVIETYQQVQSSGVQFQIDGNTSVITWNDKHYGGLKSHQKITLSATGGTNGKNTWTATNGVHTLTAWVNDTHDYRDEVNGSDDANKKSIELKIPLGAIRFFSDAEINSPDDLNTSTRPTVSKVCQVRQLWMKPTMTYKEIRFQHPRRI